MSEISIAEQLVAHARLLVEQDQRLTALEKEFVDLKNSAEPATPEDYLSIDGYARLKKIPISRSVVHHLGRKAKKLSKDKGAEIHQTRDEYTTYRTDILDDVFAAYED